VNLVNCGAMGKPYSKCGLRAIDRCLAAVPAAP
jgi:hypothetical protein